MIYEIGLDLGILLLIMVGIQAVILAIGVPRGKFLRGTRQRMAENQEHQVERHERRIATMAPIATVLKAR